MSRTKEIIGEARIENLALNIRKQRRWLRMTQAELGKQIGVAQQRIAMFEKGDAIPDIFQMEDIASVLDTTIEMLLKKQEGYQIMSIDTDRERLLQKRPLEWIRSDWKATSMITVYRWNPENVRQDYFILSGLIPPNMVREILDEKRHISRVIENVSPEPMAYSPSGESEVRYFRWGVDEDMYGSEPLIIKRRFGGMRENNIEISEEFRLFHNLHHDRKTDTYIKIDDAGNEETVAIVKPGEVQIRLKEIRQFLAVKEMYLSILFEFNEYSKYSLGELGLDEVRRGEPERDGLICWVYDRLNTPEREFLSDSRLRGRRLIAPLPKFKSGLGDFVDDPEQYAEFIVDVDDNGDKIYHTCDPNKLRDISDENLDACHKLLPVHFRKQVLDKYYNEPSKYTVDDSMLRCASLWSMQIDNHARDKVCVVLEELGIHLPYEEQLHWLAHNIPPEGGVSDTYFRRMVHGEWANSDQPDILFKQKYEQLQRACDECLGWQLLKPSEPGDQDRLRSLRVPTVNEKSHFKDLVLDIAVLLIEQLNQESLKNLIPSGERNKAKGGDNKVEINRLEYVLNSRGVTNFEKHIRFLQHLCDLRNTNSKAHIERPDDHRYKSAAKFFDLENLNYQEGLAKILEEAVQFLDFLISVVRSGELSNKSEDIYPKPLTPEPPEDTTHTPRTIVERYVAGTTEADRDEVARKVVELRINATGSRPLAWRKIREELGLRRDEFHKVIRLSKGYRKAVIDRIKSLRDQEGGWEYSGKLEVLTGIELTEEELS